MIKFYYAFFGLFFIHATLVAETSCELGFGWREDHLDWNIAAFDNDPDILSELEWNDIRMLQISGKLTSTVCWDWYLKITGDYATVYDGKNIDSDYAGNSRTRLFLRSENNASKGEAFDISVGIGYPLNYWEGFSVIPLIGYAVMEQHFHMHDGFQTVNLINGSVGPFPGLDSTYRARWVNAWLGMDFFFPIYCDTTLFCSGELHSSTFHGSGHWNLRRDFIGDFKHNSHGWGFVFTGGGDYRIWNSIYLGGRVTYVWMHASNGTDTTTFVIPVTDRFNKIIGEKVVVGKTRLNAVNWHSLRLEATVSYEF
jgi:hypothetical protein